MKLVTFMLALTALAPSAARAAVRRGNELRSATVESSVEPLALPKIGKRQVVINYGLPPVTVADAGAGSASISELLNYRNRPRHGGGLDLDVQLQAPVAQRDLDDDLDFALRVQDVENLRKFESLLPIFGVNTESVSMIRSLLKTHAIKYNLMLLQKTVAVLKKINAFLSTYLPPPKHEESAEFGSPGYGGWDFRKSFTAGTLASFNRTNDFRLLSALLDSSTPPAAAAPTISTKLSNPHKHLDIPYNNRPFPSSSESPVLAYGDFHASQIKEIIDETERIIRKHQEDATSTAAFGGGSTNTNVANYKNNNNRNKFVVTEPPKHPDFVPNFSGFGGSSVGAEPAVLLPTLPIFNKNNNNNNVHLFTLDGGLDFPFEDGTPDFALQKRLVPPHKRKKTVFKTSPSATAAFGGAHNFFDLNFNRKTTPLALGFSDRNGGDIYRNIGQIPLDKHSIFDNRVHRLHNSYGQPSRL